MGHDVIEDKYARLYEQPYQLAKLSNDVLGVCLSYRPCQGKNEYHQIDNGSLNWIGYSSGNFREKIFSYPSKALKIAKEFQPDIIVGASDCLHIILGQWLAKKLNAKFAADLYDDYETFGLAKIPFVKYLYRQALRKASVISCVSLSLTNYIKENIACNVHIFALPSTINRDLFYPKSKNESRKFLGLPEKMKLVGTAGGLTKDKGIETVYEAFIELSKLSPNLHFALAGPIDLNCPPPQHDRIHYLGKLNHAQIGDFFSSLDVGIVYLRDTKYGQLSFPQKAYEMAACKIPMVSAEVGDMRLLFSKDHNELYCADNTMELVAAITQQLKNPYIPELTIETWEQQAVKLNSCYQLVIPLS